MSVFRSAVADWNTVPTGSMQPTIVEGDRIWINKLAYDVRVPFTNIALAKLSDPQTSDIIIFDSKTADLRLVKRVIGIPGDTVEMRNNMLYINSKPLEYQPLSSNTNTLDKLEKLGDVTHKVRFHKTPSQLSSFNPVIVPDNHYMVMGDNRDNSSDSRVIGFIPRHEIIGKTESVVMSLNYDNYYIPRKERFFHQL